jgi:hypothetical protein
VVWRGGCRGGVGVFFAWKEGEVNGCCGILANIVLQINVEDNWRYDFDPFEGYSVKGRSKEPITCNEVMRNNF